jgi:hypothetical protein
MNNLVPLCSSHHRSVHEGGWKLSMHGTDRQLAITRPDERSSCAGST